MSDKSIFKEDWGSGVINSDRPADGTPQFQDPHILERRTIRTKKFGKLTHKQFQQYLQESKKSYTVHSDGFLALSHIQTPPAYICSSCGFEGLFRRDTCARCGTPTVQS